MSNRDWAEIEVELNSLVPNLPKGDRKQARSYDDRQATSADEQALLAHIADALLQERRR